MSRNGGWCHACPRSRHLLDTGHQSRTIFLASIVRLVCSLSPDHVDCDRCGRLAQWRALPSHGRGHRFDTCIARNFQRLRDSTLKPQHRPHVSAPQPVDMRRRPPCLRPGETCCCVTARSDLNIVPSILSPVPARLALGESPYRNKGPGKGHYRGHEGTNRDRLSGGQGKREVRIRSVCALCCAQAAIVPHRSEPDTEQTKNRLVLTGTKKKGLECFPGFWDGSEAGRSQGSRRSEKH